MILSSITTTDPTADRYAQFSDLPSFLAGTPCRAQQEHSVHYCTSPAERALWLPNQKDRGPFPLCRGHADRYEGCRRATKAPTATIGLVCPHCGKADSIVEEDEAVRLNTLHVENGLIFGHLGKNWQFNTRRIFCEDCGNEVTLPQEVENHS